MKKIYSILTTGSLLISSSAHSAIIHTESLNFTVDPNLTVIANNSYETVSGIQNVSFNQFLNGYTGSEILTHLEIEFWAFSDITYSQATDNTVFMPGQYNDYTVEQNVEVTTPISYNGLPWSIYEIIDDEFDNGGLLAPIFGGLYTLYDTSSFNSPWSFQGFIYSSATIKTGGTADYAIANFNNMNFQLDVTYHADEPTPVPLPPAIWLFCIGFISLLKFRTASEGLNKA